MVCTHSFGCVQCVHKRFNIPRTECVENAAIGTCTEFLKTYKIVDISICSLSCFVDS